LPEGPEETAARAVGGIAGNERRIEANEEIERCDTRTIGDFLGHLMEEAKERRAEFRRRRRRKPIHRARMMIEENDVGLRVVNGGLQFLESRAFYIGPVDRLIFRQDVI
jgi:hypothetical protein